MEGFVADLSNGEAEKNVFAAIDKYSAEFTKVIRSIVGELPVVSTTERYNDTVKKKTEEAFPEAKKPLLHVTHWILNDNGFVEYNSSATMRYRGSDLEGVVNRSVKEYILTIVARAEGPEKAADIDRYLTHMRDSKTKQVVDLISHGADRRNVPQDSRKIRDAMDRMGVRISPYVSAGEQIAPVIDQLRPLLASLAEEEEAQRKKAEEKQRKGEEDRPTKDLEFPEKIRSSLQHIIKRKPKQ